MLSLCPGVRVALVVMLGTTTAVAFKLFPLLDYLQKQEDGQRKFPCPDDIDIAPCTCDFISSNLELNCSQITTEDLRRVFSAAFPFNKFNRFMLQDSDIPVLENGVFQGVVFNSVVFEFNNMTRVEPGALSDSYGILEIFTMHEEASSLPYDWPLPDLGSFITLKKIDVSGPYAAVDPLVSDSLTEVDLRLYNLTELPASSFSGATKIKTIILQDTKLESIEANTFASLTELETLEITGASLTTLVQSSMAFSSTNLGTVQLSMNDVVDVKDDAFSGLPESVVVDLSNNLLAELRSGAFAPVLYNLTSGHMDVGNNPLLCGCDLAWLVYLEEEQRDRLHGLGSSCSIEGNYNPSDILDFLEYQCSTDSFF